MTTPASPLKRPPGRYDEPAALSKPVLATVAVVAALVLLTFSYFAYNNYTANRTTFGVLSFQVLNDHEVELTFEVNKDLNQSVTCALVAMDSSHNTVGKQDVVVGPADHDPARDTERFATSARATNVDVTSCSTPTP